MSKLDYEGATSSQFSASDADISVISSDNVLFRLHRTNIEVQAGGFTPINQQRLPEPAHVLVILFQFLYPQRHPKLTNTRFETVQALATAAERYKIFSAMHISQVRLREFLPQCAKEILKYAIEFDYLDLVDETALLCARSPVCDMLIDLPSQVWVPWLIRLYLSPCRHYTTKPGKRCLKP
ncbi:hypothetical protein HYPSUDRAFT_579476 [Hypholoma sublateritium FD-334 SS-4]|uniref:BTB domain-containing protein n=1 Tax=Hypholoma sublateritium (strain FD-334 SS-4) TaxID=945553 RepID=A0A0D2NXJ3_HYPSF|nr:hypothetical protein HYPSUDRAFT_579476 [Hypholoma sublateritium FD-334 SS-4]